MSINVYAYNLEKTTWTYKSSKEKDLSNMNIELILYFSDKFKFEINLNKYYAHL